ncbi:MAG TPA: DUF2232 domain-containing protein [Xanthobacteraceae bacterium]|nr:DUF2232 domain-containing protein [Xanthobacteraceae bacterium]
MIQIVLVGLGAGAAAALLCASVVSGSVLATLLLYLSPLPIMIAALGFTHWAGLVAALTAAVGLGSVLGLFYFGGFLLGMALPAWWLGYLALLARPSTAQSGVEWYPIGRIVLWAAALGAAIVTVAILQIGTDQETIRSALRKGFDEIIRAQIPASTGSGAVLTPEERGRLLDVFVVLFPPAAAVSLLVINSFNLWLAGRIVLVSGRLSRPWPDISAISLPLAAPIALAVSVAGAFAPDVLGMVCGIAAAVLLMVHVMVGLAVIHAVTIGMNARVLILASVYAGFVMLSLRTSWASIVLAALGLAETLFGLRWRLAAYRGPPSPPKGPPANPST